MAARTRGGRRRRTERRCPRRRDWKSVEVLRREGVVEQRLRAAARLRRPGRPGTPSAGCARSAGRHGPTSGPSAAVAPQRPTRRRPRGRRRTAGTTRPSALRAPTGARAARQRRRRRAPRGGSPLGRETGSSRSRSACSACRRPGRGGIGQGRAQEGEDLDARHRVERAEGAQREEGPPDHAPNPRRAAGEAEDEPCATGRSRPRTRRRRGWTPRGHAPSPPTRARRAPGQSPVCRLRGRRGRRPARRPGPWARERSRPPGGTGPPPAPRWHQRASRPPAASWAATAPGSSR